jgi:hypothetical protein
MELRELKSVDVWQMVRVLKKFDIRAAFSSLDKDLLRLSSLKAPTMVDEDGNIVPLPKDQWTQAQTKAMERARVAKDELTWQILGVVMENIERCENEVNTLLVMGTGTDMETIQEMPADDYLALIVQYVTREGFSDFFTHAMRLLSGKSFSRGSIVTAVTSIK